jgi:hypothetical protein
MRQSRVALPYFGFWRRMMGKADECWEEPGKRTQQTAGVWEGSRCVNGGA